MLAGVFSTPEWLAHDARDLLTKLLQPDPSQRISLTEIEVRMRGF